MNKIDMVEQQFLRKDLPDFRPGDTVRVMVKIPEDEKIRLQAFEGIVIRKRGRGMNATFTVRRMSYGEGVERTFPLHTQSIQSLAVLKSGKVRRARLYYLRKKVGRHGRIEEEVGRTAGTPSVETTAAPSETAGGPTPPETTPPPPKAEPV